MNDDRATIKRLVLFRHAKSDWNANFESDHGRPLSTRGVKAAALMGRLLSATGQVPQLVITSSAIRARSTAERAIAEGRWQCPLKMAEWLYETEPRAVLEKIRKLPQDADVVMLVGHEPTWSELTSTLIGGGRIRFPTAALAGIDFDVQSWGDIGRGTGELVWLLRPRCFSSIKF